VIRLSFTLLVLLAACERSEPEASVEIEPPAAAAPSASARMAVPPASTATASASTSAAAELIPPFTEEQRKNGFDECNVYDPLGFGPYSSWVQLPPGKMLIPDKGGHTPDMGYDVLLHFNGAESVRRLLVQVSKGLVLVLVDKANGGAYARAVASKDIVPVLKKSIERALRKHSGDDRAHIRHFAVSAWSAGTIAIDRILARNPEGVDAYVIMDGLHGAWRQRAPREQKSASLDARFVAPEIELAKRAQRGETLFVLTHSRINPGLYPSTYATAGLILDELGLKSVPVDPGSDPYGQTSTVDVNGLHVWGYRGNDVKAHCTQLSRIARIVTEVIEPAWNTPAMDRSGPPRPLPGHAPKTPRHAVTPRRAP
jgi:hypothetical protein